MAITPRAFRAFSIADLAAVSLVVVTGAAVRLTGSGLGCPDWPNCLQHQFVAPLGSTHAVIEDANRAVTGLLIGIAALTFLAAWLRRPRRRDLLWLAGGVGACIIADALLGAEVVYSKLNPWLVSSHLALSLVTVIVAAVLVHRATYAFGPGARREVRCGWSSVVARWLWVPFGITVLFGMATTGSGPHSGGSVGQLVAKRLPFSLQSAAWVHSAAAAAFLGIVGATYVALMASGAPRQVVIGAQRLLAVGIAQGIIGIVQYALHLPVVLVELHVIGALSLTIGVLQFQLRHVARDAEVVVLSATQAASEEPSLVAL